MSQRPEPPPTVVGVAWYRREDWDDVRRLCDQANQLQDTYDEWLADAEDALRRLAKRGIAVKKVFIAPSEFVAWCLVRARERNAEARSEYVSDRLAKGDPDSSLLGKLPRL